MEPTSCKKCKLPFCQACFDSYLLQTNQTCPSGCQNGIQGGPFPRKNNKALKCLYFRCLNQCDTQINYLKLFSHDNECARRVLYCKLCQLDIPIYDMQEHVKICNDKVADLVCEYCSERFKATMASLHLEKCEQAPTKCVGEKCDFSCPRVEMAAHEDVCPHIAQTCTKCKDEVPRSEQEAHDCVKSLLARFKIKAAELTELTNQMSSVKLDISK